MKFYSQVVFSTIVCLLKKAASYLLFFYRFFTFRFHFLYIIEQVNSNRSGRRYEKEASCSSLLVNWFFPFAYSICNDFWTNHNRNSSYKNGKIVASKESVDKFRKEFSTYWWEDYKFEADYDQGELVIYLPKGKEDNQFTNIDDVLSAISLRQYQFKDKRLTVLLLSNSGEKLARLKNGKVTKGYSDKVDKKVVASRLAEWKKTNTPTKTSDSSHPKTTTGSTTVPPATNSSESSSTSSHLSGTSQ